MSLPLDEIERLARAATPGPWMPDGEDFWTVQGGANMGLVAQVGNPAYPSTKDEANARYIAALSPDVVLELVAEVRRLRDVVELADVLLAKARSERDEREGWRQQAVERAQLLGRRVETLRCAMSEAIGELVAGKPVDAMTLLEDHLNADEPPAEASS